MMDRYMLTVPAEAPAALTLRAFVSSVARQLGADEGLIEDLKLLVTELCASAIDASCERLDLALGRDDHEMVLEVRGCGALAERSGPEADDPIRYRLALPA